MMATAQAKAPPKLCEPKPKKGKNKNSNSGSGGGVANNKVLLQNGISEPKQPLDSMSSSSSSDSNHNVNNSAMAGTGAAASGPGPPPPPPNSGHPLENHNSGYSFRNFLSSSSSGSGGPGSAPNGNMTDHHSGGGHHVKGGENDGAQQQHGYPSYTPVGYPPYSRSGPGGYEQHLNSEMASVYNNPSAYPPPMRFPGKPLPGPPSQPSGGPPSQYPGGPLPPPHNMRGGYPPGIGHHGQPPTGPTPTLNQLLQSSGGGGGAGASTGGGGGSTVMTGHGHSRYPPPPPPPGGYEQHNASSYPTKADYPGGPSGWPGGPPPPQSQRPPVNSYGHPQPPPQHIQQHQQQQMYRQGSPAGPPPRPPPPSQHQQQTQQPQYYNPPPGLHHPQHGQQQYPPPPPQSPHYPPPPPHSAQRYPPGIGRPGETQPPSHYSVGMPAESPVHQPPPSASSVPDGHPPKSTPPPPPSPSLSQQHQMNHSQQLNPPSPQQSSRTAQQQLIPPTSNSGNSSNSSSHRPQGSSPPNSYAPPDVGEVTGCNSNDNDSAGGLTGGGMRPSPSPTGSASSRSMSPAIGNTNIPVPPRPSSSQSDGSSGPPRMSQSPMPGGGPYPPQQTMAPPSHHHMYPVTGPSAGKLGHPSLSLPQPGSQQPGHYPQQGQHWPPQPQQQPYGGAPGNRHGQHEAMMRPSPYPTNASQMQGIPPNYPPQPRHSHPNHAPPPQSPYGSYPPPQFASGHPSPQPPQWPPQGSASQQPPNSSPRSQPNQHYLKQHLAQKMANYSHQGGYPSSSGHMGPPSSGLPPASPSQTPPPQMQQHSGQQHLGPLHPSHHPSQQQGPHDSTSDSMENSNNPPNIISMGPDGPMDDVSQQSTLSNASGASGDDGPAMPKLRKEGPLGHSYPSHPTTPQAASSPNAGNMSSMHDEYGDGSSPGWPRTPTSPVLNSHPPAATEHYRPKVKVKKPDSMTKLYDMDDNPDRRMFLDKLLHFMDDHGSAITACPTISKNPLDLFKLYFLVKERGGFLEVTKNKTWKDIAGSLGIGASSSAAYTLRKHYTKHLLPFECKFDRGGIDPQPLINQVEASTKKKGAKTAPVPSPGSSNSQDSFPGPNTNTNSSMDGFPYPAPYGGPPAEYGGTQGVPPQRPNSTTGQPQPHTGYPVQPGSYQPYPPPPSSSEYSRGPPPPPHEYAQGSYGAPTPSGYPPPPQGRPMYGYGPGGPEGTPSGSQTPSQQPAGPTAGSTPDEQHQRYNMGPPTTGPTSGGYPPSHGGRPPYAPGQGPPPPNGYPGQDYYPPDQLSTGMPQLAGHLTSSSPELSSLKSTLQGYLPIPGQPAAGKHHPPPHPNQMRRMDYPPQGGAQVKDPSAGAGNQGYPGYPPQSQPSQPQQSRMQPYDGGSPVQGQRPPGGYLYPAGAGRESGSGTPNRSSPSPSPSTTNTLPPHPHTQSSKQWIPPEGWQNVSGQYQQPRPYGPPQGPSVAPSPGPISPHGSQSTIPVPSVHSPVAPMPPTPQQAPSPQSWGTPGPLGSRVQHQPGSPSTPPGPVGWNHSGSSVTSSQPGPVPSGVPTPQQQWSQQHSTPRNSGRPSFPSSKSDLYKGYQPSGPMLPPSSSIPSGKNSLSGSLSPINQLAPIPVLPPHPPQLPLGPQTPTFSQIPIQPSLAPVKKEIVFPPDSIEGIIPLLSRRRKLHKNDVAPVEAWRIMMCLKSGLLAETTWALDILNILLYDDHSITYFSLTYLPGLLDLLLEQLRRSLILIFGQSVGLEITTDKEEIVQPKEKRPWYESTVKCNEEEVDIGTPLTKFPRDGHRTYVLHGTPNYTLKTRARGKPVKILSRDDEPFVLNGPRDWDTDEKLRNDPDNIGQQNGTMEITRHVVTSFTSDLNIVPLVRILKKDVKIKSEMEPETETPPDTGLLTVKSEPMDSQPINLDMYNCETKLATECVSLLSARKLNGSSLTTMEDSNSQSSSHSQDKKNSQHSFMHSPSNSNSGSLKCSKLTRGKAKKLESILTRIRDVNVEGNENAMSESPLEFESVPKTVTDLLANSQSDNAVMSGIEDNSNMSNNTDNSSSDFCDNTTTNTNGNTISAKKKKISTSSSAAKIRASGSALKRRKMEEYEDECYTRDEPSLYLITETQDTLARRCLSICNVIRNLTFVPGNDVELGKSQGLLNMLGKLILLHHDHPLKGKHATCSKGMKSNSTGEEDNTEILPLPIGEIKLEESEDGMNATAAAVAAAADIDSESCTSLRQEDDWWWEYTHHIREHVLVIIANISGQVDLSKFSEEISRPILDGLLHWTVCPAAYGQDPFPTLGPQSNSNLSPQRLAIEAICKLSVTQGNVDLLLATPPYSRIEKLCQLLSRGLCRTEDQVQREFSVNLLCYLSGADSGIARTVALQNPCISLLISFIEQAEANAMNIANNHGFSVLRENPDSMGTSLDMLRRAANTLLNLAKHPDNRALFVHHEPRLLNLVMSQILEQKVAAIVAQVLYQCSAPEGSHASKGSFYTNSCNDRFYTPSLSRSRAVVSVGNPSLGGGVVPSLSSTPPPSTSLPSSRLTTSLPGSKDPGSFPFFNNSVKHGTTQFIPSS